MKLLIGVVVAAFVVIVAFMSIDPKIEANNQPGVSEPFDASHVFSMTVEGQVEKPGTYALKEGAQMKDLIDAAGGVTNNADPRAYFESVSLVKGQTYYIAPTFNEDDVCATEEIKKVNINIDNVETLMTVNGFSNSIASAVVDYRAENGNFETIDELEKVYGIGPATFRKLRNYVILHA